MTNALGGTFLCGRLRLPDLTFCTVTLDRSRFLGTAGWATLPDIPYLEPDKDAFGFGAAFLGAAAGRLGFCSAFFGNFGAAGFGLGVGFVSAFFGFGAAGLGFGVALRLTAPSGTSLNLEPLTCPGCWRTGPWPSGAC